MTFAVDNNNSNEEEGEEEEVEKDLVTSSNFLSITLIQ